MREKLYRKEEGNNMTRYVHTNIIAKDCEKLIEFYKEVFGCRSIGEKRDLRGTWLDKLTGIPNAHIVGEHLVMPGYDEDHPTLEIFSYDQMNGDCTHRINTYGIAHLAFEVDNVAETLEKVLAKGGGIVGELVHADYEDGRKATFVYATDIEGNILELQSWNQ
jgi:predicted enzyme related to lactoylglutathione lyase